MIFTIGTGGERANNRKSRCKLKFEYFHKHRRIKHLTVYNIKCFYNLRNNLILFRYIFD